MIRYAIIVLRGQPFHIGHQHIADKAIEDGYIPVFILGSANESGTEKNPYTVHQRAFMIRLVYPDALIGALNDTECYSEWLDSLVLYVEHLTESPITASTIYLHEKLEDLHDFTFRGVDYMNESYCKMYEVTGMHTTSLPLSDIQIRAKSIREDLEGNKQYLHHEVYNYIKEINETKKTK